ncbi:Hypothetical predicted protein [Pelobates cultripes]|uniref:Golgi associated RAB2 interactor protein-like Rab2B-binding domain-containing protein n=1 Tax=Pelobates cultripes TaxID=61616 RepID=A0AAD1TEJ8_PELCU|nr:Hypothetical predicted protein [Pelobates cultripes]
MAAVVSQRIQIPDSELDMVPADYCTIDHKLRQNQVSLALHTTSSGGQPAATRDTLQNNHWRSSLCIKVLHPFTLQKAMDRNTVELELKDTCQESSTPLEGYGKLQRFLKGGEYYMFKHSTMFECTFVQVLENGCGVSISCPTPVLILGIASIDPTLPAEVLFIAELLVNEDPICAKLEPMKLTRLYPLTLVSITVIDAESGRLKITFVTGSSYYLEPYDNESREAVQFKTFLIDWLKTKKKKHLEETPIISFQNKVNENEHDENR